MTRHRRPLTGPEATVASFAIVGGSAVTVAAVAYSPAAFLGLCITVMVCVGFR